jgi:hypothetical protein
MSYQKWHIVEVTLARDRTRQHNREKATASLMLRPHWKHQEKVELKSPADPDRALT